MDDAANGVAAAPKWSRHCLSKRRPREVLEFRVFAQHLNSPVATASRRLSLSPLVDGIRKSTNTLVIDMGLKYLGDASC
jgi:hypothetical protein